MSTSEVTRETFNFHTQWILARLFTTSSQLKYHIEVELGFDSGSSNFIHNNNSSSTYKTSKNYSLHLLNPGDFHLD